MNVRQLAGLFNDLVYAGHGNDDVFVNLYGRDLDARTQNILDRHLWAIADVAAPSGEGFVTLDARADS